MVPIGLVYSIHDPTEVAIQKMIDASQRIIDVQSQVGEKLKMARGLKYQTGKVLLVSRRMGGRLIYAS